MNDNFEKAKQEANRLVDDLQAGAERVKEGLEKHISAQRVRGGGFGVIIHQLRTAHLAVLVLQLLVLYFELGSLGVPYVFLPSIFIILNIVGVGRRWYHHADGRFDFQQLTGKNTEPILRVQYGYGLFGGIFLAILAQYVSPTMPSSVVSILYRFATGASVLIGGASAGIEVYEGAKENKKR